ncbi:MAG: MBL fold metallo-hydrolase RNA specificity domain-containing protein, partial [Candidatus Binataceae bacterium]
GQLAFPSGTYIDRAEAEFLESKRLCFLTSGSQGEPMSALSKLAGDNHPYVHIAPNDVVVLSSRFIPGNERTINSVVNQLYKRGAEVIYDAIAPVHVSGHACRDELAEMMRLVRPKYFVPIHGEYRHLSLHLALAAELGIPARKRMLLEDGDTLVMTGGEIRRGRPVIAGRVAAEGGEFGDPELMRERRALARDGTVIAIVAISSRTGKIVAGPEVLSRGVVSGDGISEHIANARAEVADRVRELNGFVRGDGARLKVEMVRALRHYFGSATGKRPLIVPYVMEV